MAKSKNSREIPVVEALRRHATPTAFDEVQTDFPGTGIRVEEGTAPDIPRKDRGILIRTAATFYMRKVYLEGRSAVQERRADLLKSMAVRYPGFRGVVSRPRNFILNVIPKTTIEWQRQGLKDALGATYPAVVAEDYKLTVTAPDQLQTSEGLMDGEQATKRMIYLGGIALGIPEEDIPRIVKTETELRVDETKAHQMVSDGQVSAEDINNAGVATETMAVTTDQLKKD